MGAGHGKEKNKSPIPPPTSVDAIRNLLSGSTGLGNGRQDKRLDATLTGFLRVANMSGLEYRLRMAGIYTLEDLVVSDETILSRHGFTLLMARRLFRALDEYLLKPEFLFRASTSEGPDAPEDQTRTSTLLLSRDSYRKRNKRRGTTPYSRGTPSRKKEETPPTSSSSMGGHKPKVFGSPVNSLTSIKEVTSSDSVRKQNVFEVVAEVKSKGGDVFEEQGKAESEGLVRLPPNNETPSSPFLTTPPTHLSPIPREQRLSSLAETLLQDDSPIAIERHLSMPIGLNCIHDDCSSLWHVAQYSGRNLSCPSLVLPDDTSLSPEVKPADFEEILFALQSQEPRDIEKLLSLLYSLLEFVKFSCLRNITDPLKTVSAVLFNHLSNVLVAEVSCKILKYLSSGLSHVSIPDPDVLEKVLQVVLEAIKVHTFSRRCQLNGCLVINNIYRSGHPAGMKTDEILSILSSSLEYYQKNETVVLALMSGIVAVLASDTEPHSTVSHQKQLCLEQICHVMDTFLDNVQLLQYALSFFTLALIEVAPQVDDTLMNSMLRLVTLSLKTHKERSDIAVWGCKAVSQMSAHKLVEEESTGKKLTDCLSDILSLHPTSSGVQLWGSYALYQLASYNSSIIPHVKDIGCLEQRKHSLPHLNEEARSYVEQLAQLATL